MPAGRNSKVSEIDFLKNFGRLVDGVTGEAYNREKFEAMVELKKITLEERTSHGDFVVFQLSNSPDFFLTLFACWDLKLIPVVIPPRSSYFEVDNVRHRFQARAIISDNDVQYFDKVSETTFTIPAHIRLNTALVMLTSGTLGEPKAIFLSFQALQEKFAALEQAIPLEERQNAMCFLPLCFGHGLICNSLFPLLSGSTLYIFPSFELKSAPLNLEALEKYKIHFFSTVPVILKILIQQKLPTHELCRVHCASAPLFSDTWKAADRWIGNGVSLTHVYGLTEFSGWVSGSPSLGGYTQGQVGTGWNVEFQAPQSGEPAEISLRGAGIMSGYLENGTFNVVDRDSWFATGDYGKTDANGRLILMGRKKDIINFGGFKVYPEDIEALLLQNPLVKEACCFAMNSENLGEVPAAAVVLQGEITERDLRKWCGERIHTHKVPVRWYFLDQLPVSERGKVSRKRVREVCESIEERSGR